MSQSLEQLLANPSIENWKAIVEIGKHILRPFRGAASMFAMRDDAGRKSEYKTAVISGVQSWPPEIERKCPNGWPREFTSAVENRRRETDLYQHYIAKLATHSELQLSDGTQAVWLERRFTGGVVDIGVVRSAMSLLYQAIKAVSWTKVQEAIRLLQGGTRNIGKIGCADMTGGVVAEHKLYLGITSDCPPTIVKHEYRLEIEVKVGDEPQRPEQIARMNSVWSRGGCYIIARSVEQCVQDIKAFRQSKA